MVSDWFNHVIACRLLQMQGPTVPPHPPGGLGGDEDEDTYEEAEPYAPAETTVSNTGTCTDTSRLNPATTATKQKPFPSSREGRVREQSLRVLW